MTPSKKILLVEDDTELKTLLCEFLRGRGYLVNACASGTEALSKLKDGCDLVITDLKMKPLDGIETMQRIHAVRPELPVVVISAYGTPVVARDAFRKGAVDFLTKPFALSQIDHVARRELR